MRRRRRRLVDIAAALSLIGLILRYVSLTFAAPAAVALVYGEALLPFAVGAAVSLAAGIALERATGDAGEIGVREGFLVVALAWLAVAAVGAVPYMVAADPQLNSPTDAYFEAMSGFTTTGASVLTDIEALPHALLFWRALTQWLGGMGIVVLALAVLPRLAVGGQQLMEHEAPGPELEKLTPRIRETAQRLWLLYVALSAGEIALLWALGAAGVSPNMDFFQAATHTFATMSTGGFSPRARSMEEFGAEAQLVVTAFMLVAGANFALLYRAARGRPLGLVRDEELRLYAAMFAVATAVVAAELIRTDRFDHMDALRHAAFQVASIVTTTGFASTDFAGWAVLALATLVVLMFVGGCSGSTAGSVKIIRYLLVGRLLRRQVALTAHRNAVIPLRLNGRVVDEGAVWAAAGFVLIYLAVAVVGTLALLVEGARGGVALTAFEAVSAAATTLGNVGPGVGFLGPMGSFDPFTDFSKWLMVALMWVGRLEILPVLVLLTRSYWRA